MRVYDIMNTCTGIVHTCKIIKYACKISMHTCKMFMHTCKITMYTCILNYEYIDILSKINSSVSFVQIGINTAHDKALISQTRTMKYIGCVGNVLLISFSKPACPINRNTEYHTDKDVYSLMRRLAAVRHPQILFICFKFVPAHGSIQILVKGINCWNICQ